MPSRLSRLKLDEISLVDVPANKGARVALYKRHDEATRLVSLAKFWADDDSSPDFREALEDAARRELQSEIFEEVWPLIRALEESTLATMKELSGDARDNQLRENVQAFLDQLRAMPAVIKREENGMTAEELKKRLEAAEAQVAELTKRSETAEKMADMDDMEKAYMGSLKDEATKAKFMEMDKAGRKKEMDKVGFRMEKRADEFVEIDGQKIAKSEVPAPVLAAIQKQADRLAKMETQAEEIALAKRAEEVLPNLAGAPVAKGKLLKAAETLGDDVVEALKAADAAASAASKVIGKGGGMEPGSPAEKLEKMARDHAASNNVGYEVAYAEVTKSGEGRDLYLEVRRAH